MDNLDPQENRKNSIETPAVKWNRDNLLDYRSEFGSTYSDNNSIYSPTVFEFEPDEIDRSKKKIEKSKESPNLIQELMVGIQQLSLVPLTGAATIDIITRNRKMTCTREALKFYGKAAKLGTRKSMETAPKLYKHTKKQWLKLKDRIQKNNH